MTLRAPPSYLGIPVRTASLAEMRVAILNGRLIQRKDGWAFYQYGEEIYVMSTEPDTAGEERPR